MSDTTPPAVLSANTLPLAPAVASALARWAQMNEGAYSPETFRALKQDGQSFAAYCGETGASVLPALPDTVASYVRREAAAGRAVATIKRRVASIAALHRAAQLTNPCDSEDVRAALRTDARTRGTDQRQAAGLTENLANRIIGRVDVHGARPKDVRDMALMLAGRDLLARASELVSVTVEAIAWDEADGTALVSLRRGKTSTQTDVLMLGADAAAALRRWLEVSGITHGPVFMGLTKGGKLTGAPLLAGDVNRIVKALADRAGLGDGFSAHSLRVGMAQDLVADDVDGASIMQAAGWRTPAMLTRYTRKLSAKRGAIAKYHARHK